MLNCQIEKLEKFKRKKAYVKKITFNKRNP